MDLKNWVAPSKKVRTTRRLRHAFFHLVGLVDVHTPVAAAVLNAVGARPTFCGPCYGRA